MGFRAQTDSCQLPPRGTVNSQLADDLDEVIHSDRGENIGIISARKTMLRERKHYEEEN